MTTDRRRFRGGAAGPLGVALIAGLVLAACGGSSGASSKTASTGSGTSSSSPGTTRTGGFSANRSKLATCLKQHGVTLPSGGFGAGRFGGGTGPSGVSGFRPGGFGGTGATGVRPGGFRRFGATGPSGAGGFAGGNSKFAAALKACGAGFGGGGFGGGGFGRPGGAATFSATSAADRAAVTKYVACVRKHGFKLPSPNFSGKGPVFSSTQVDRSNPKFVAASAACQSLLKFSSS
jgi:hypothetical protein